MATEVQVWDRMAKFSIAEDEKLTHKNVAEV